MAVTQIKVLKLGAKPPIIEFEGESTDTKPTYGGANSKFTENDTGKKFYFDGTEWKALATGDGGSGGGGSLPANFPAEDAENADKFIGFDENGEYAVLDVPSGGGEPFVVTMELDMQTEKLVGDKTYAEVYTAYTDGQRVRFVLDDETIGMSMYFDLLFASFQSQAYAFGMLISGEAMTMGCEAANASNYFTISMGG